MFGIRAKYLYPKRQFVFDMVREILLTSCLEDEKRLRGNPLQRQGTSCRPPFRQRGICPRLPGRSLISLRLSSGEERTAGITYYRLVEELESHFEERKEEIIRNLKLLMKYLFRPENLTVSITAEKEGLTGVKEAALDLRSSAVPGTSGAGKDKVYSGTEKTKVSKPPVRCSL